MCLEIILLLLVFKGWDSSVGSATRYGLDGPGDRILVGSENFPRQSRPALGPTQPPRQWVSRISLG